MVTLRLQTHSWVNAQKVSPSLKKAIAWVRMDGWTPACTPLLPGISPKRQLCENTKLNSDVVLAMVFFAFFFCLFVCWVWTCLHLVVTSAFINSVAVVWNRLGIR